MPIRRRALLRAAVPASLLAAPCTGAQAQGGAAAAWAPGRPVRLVAPFAPGGTVDVVARLLAPRLSERLGQPLAVENRGGAGGSIGAAEVARPRPDGTTLMVGSNGPVVLNPLLQARLPYDPARDLQPIGLAIRVPVAVVASAALPLRSLEDLLALARARPGQLGAASAGTGSSNHLAIELFNAEAGVRLTHVPYRGSGAAVADLVSGTVAVIFDQLSTALPLHAEGRARILAVAAERRTPLLPEVPTLAEGGVRDAEATTFNGLFAPACLPPEALAGLALAFAAAMAEEPLRERLAALGAEVATAEEATPWGFAAVIRAEAGRARRAVALAGLKPE